MTHDSTPNLIPVLSRGKHRNPRKGACFMEYASFLAGEPWSDHPGCTHPLLAALARDINDHLGDEARQETASLIPEVIGLNRTEPIFAALIAREAALAALPVASAERQCLAAVGILHCEQVINELEGHPAGHLSDRAEAVLSEVPHASEWARDFCSIGFGRVDKFSRRSAPTIIRSAVSGIAQAVVDDPDRLLVDLLRRTIVGCRDWMRPDPALEAADLVSRT